MKIIESSPPPIIGFAEIDPRLQFHGNYSFDSVAGVAELGEVLAKKTVHIDWVEVTEAIAPVWRQAEADFRNLYNLADDVVLRHSLRVRPDSMQDVSPPIYGPTLRELMGFPKRTHSRPGGAHIDVNVLAHPGRARYTYASSASTEFFLGKRWIIPFNPDTGVESPRIASVLMETLANSLFILPQLRHSMYYQPQPGSIVRVGTQVHRKPSRAYSGPEAGILIVNDIGVKRAPK